MRKSLSRVKKYLGSPLQNSIQTQNYNHRENISLPLPLPRNTQTSLNVPQLVCQNQDLKEKVILLEKQKQLLQKSIKSHLNESESSYSRHTQKRPSRSMQKQYKSHSNSYQIRYFNKNPQKQSYKIDRSRLSKINNYPQAKQQIIEMLQAEAQKNRKLQLKIKRLNLTIQNQTKQKQQLTKIINQLRNKLSQSTQYLLKIQRLPSPQARQQYLKNLQALIKQKQQRNVMLQQKNSQPSRNSIEQHQLQQYEQKMLAYYYTKDQNYRLRDKIAELILNNKLLKEKVVYSSKAIDHLWKIKQIQLQNLNQCLKQMKEQ